MTDFKFEQEDFDPLYTVNERTNIAYMANKLIREWIEKVPIIYGKGNPVLNWDTIRQEATFKGRIIAIEPIEKCEHLRYNVGVSSIDDLATVKYICNCGVEVKPVSFEEVK